jgi:hypothetical protein
MTFHKTITMQEALTYIAAGVLHLDLPEEFKGNITCTLSEDEGHFDIVAIDNTNQFN